MKKFIALILSVIMLVTCMVPVFAAENEDTNLLAAQADEQDDSQDSEGGFSFDINDILSSDLVQGIITSDGFADITVIVIGIMAKMDKEALKQMGKDELTSVVQNTFNTVADAIKLIYNNKDLYIVYDVSVIDNLFGTNLGALQPKPDDDDKPSTDLEIGPGDVDGDGKITAADARLILRRAAKLITFTVEQDALADVDNDGKVTAKDARLVLRVSAGLATL